MTPSELKYEVERVVNDIEFRIENSTYLLEMIKLKTLKQLGETRFPNKGKNPGIYFAKSYDGIQILSVSKPELVGEDVSQFTDPNGIVTHELFMRIVNNSDGGFADYSWFNPTNKEIQKKRSFIKGVPELQLYIGAGFWFDDINSVIDAKKIDLIKDVKIYFIIVVLIILILYILIFASCNCPLAYTISSNL